MNQPLLLHVVERLEGLVGKLPASIQKPILSELTPLKELFLQQRPPRFLLSGSIKSPAPKIVATLFGGGAPEQAQETSVQSSRWQDLNVEGRGTISVLDSRGADDSDTNEIQKELMRQPADIILFLDDGDTT